MRLAAVDPDSANLDELAAAADGAAGAPPPGEGPAPGEGPGPAPPGPDTAAMIAGVMGALLGKAKQRFPSLVTVWTDSDVQNFAGALAPLLDKYGLSPAWFELWRVEITAALVCGPLVLATFVAIRADLQSERARAAKDAGAGSTARAAPAAGDPAPEVKPRSTGEI